MVEKPPSVPWYRDIQSGRDHRLVGFSDEDAIRVNSAGRREN